MLFMGLEWRGKFMQNRRYGVVNQKRFGLKALGLRKGICIEWTGQGSDPIRWFNLMYLLKIPQLEIRLLWIS